MRTLHAAPPVVKKRTFEALVRPTLEYASEGWSSNTQTKIDIIEQVQSQRAAARIIKADYRRSSSVTAMLTDLNWDRLATRFYQIQYGLMKICLPDVVILAFNRTRHNHEMKYRTIGCTRLIYKNSFFVWMIPVWNSLPGRRSSLCCNGGSLPETGLSCTPLNMMKPGMTVL